MSHFSHTIDGQINEPNKKVVSPVTFEWPLWLTCLCPFLGSGNFSYSTDSIQLIIQCLPVLVGLAMQAVHSAMASTTTTIFSLVIKTPQVLVITEKH